MRKQLYTVCKNYFRTVILLTRADRKISQEEMASFLEMSVRSYAALENGESCFGQITFLLYLERLCPDRDAFLDGLFAVMRQVS